TRLRTRSQQRWPRVAYGRPPRGHLMFAQLEVAAGPTHIQRVLLAVPPLLSLEYRLPTGQPPVEGAVPLAETQVGATVNDVDTGLYEEVVKREVPAFVTPSPKA